MIAVVKPDLIWHRVFVLEVVLLLPALDDHAGYPLIIDRAIDAIPHPEHQGHIGPLLVRDPCCPDAIMRSPEWPLTSVVEPNEVRGGVDWRAVSVLVALQDGAGEPPSAIGLELALDTRSYLVCHFHGGDVRPSLSRTRYGARKCSGQ